MKIVIDSNIGGGKSTLITHIGNNTRIPIFLEPVNRWSEYLDEFYKDPKKWALAFNLNVLCSYSDWTNNHFDSIYERSPYTCRHVFTQLQHDNGDLHPLELKVFDKIFKELSWKPDVIIYIKTDPQICYERMNKRGRDCEKTVNLEYLVQIDEMYEKYIEREVKDESKIYKVDGNRSEELVYADVMKIINKLIPN